MATSDPAAFAEEAAFEAMRSRLHVVAGATPPHFDPRSLALRALVAAERLRQADFVSKMEALARAGVFEPRKIEDLRVAARALLYVLSKRGVPVDAAEFPCASELLAEALEHKREGVDVLEALHDDETRLWLDVFRLPSDDLCLVYDLRSMARLYEEHEGPLRERHDPTRRARTARRCANALEERLMGTCESEWTQWIDRAFTMTLSLYEEVCRMGRFLSTSHALALAFPSTACIARTRRRPRGPASSNPTLRRDLQQPAAPQREPEPEPEPMAARASGLVLKPGSSVPPESARSQRGSNRRRIELEVSFASESNFYTGFTENLSEGGVFVATYLVRPLRSLVELSLRLLGRDEPLSLRGEVRWLRLYSPTSDACPGMGIRFHSLSEADRADIAAFLAKRAPIFFSE